MTLDFNLSFADPNHPQKKQSNPVLIAEVKREAHKAPSRFMDLMDQFRHKPVSFSKYCIGCAQLYPERIKTNHFKETLMALARIPHEEGRMTAYENSVSQ